MKKTFLAAAMAAFLLASCSDNKKGATAETETAKQEHADGMPTAGSIVVETPDYKNVSASVKTQVSQVLDQYLKLKNALVEANAADARTAAGDILTLANAMPVATITGEEKAFAEEKTAAIKESASQISQAADIKAQREHLEQLSNAVYSLTKAFGAADQTLYYQHCPMARNDQGGYWISTNEEIRNPYFGDAMLKCGTNEEVYN
ncbi:DUF3347 domain-containing protein [Pontibacter harenae]|uniref:DUF3347 domain-containing protein n=1 Tax=Pontibacter harenae TaxID=2894083 RepID=UPI001E2ED6B7|nr:DUF3347 domain-containing protein [Pontibacter harenae]MCC9167439.1 DUF3347 domain-containing protein [Pontibacter harenae]